MKITLRPLKRSDKEYFYNWWNDVEIRQLTSMTTEILKDKEVDQMIDAKLNNSVEKNLIIEANFKPIGHIFVNKDRRKKYYCFYIAIGEKDYWDQGFGTESLKLACDWFWKNFPEEGTVEIEVNIDNPRAFRCYEKVGFRKVGRKKYKYYKDTFLMRLNKEVKV